MPILIVTALIIVGALPLLYWLRFDFNPMNLRNPNVESVATYLELQTNQDGGANDIEALEPSLAAADEMAVRLRALPQVARVTTLSTFIPDQQDAEAAADSGRGRDARPRAQSAARSATPPTDADNVATINCTRGRAQQARRRAARTGRRCRKPPGHGAWSRSPRPIRRRGSAPTRPSCEPLKTALGDLRDLLKAQEVTRDNLPPELVRSMDHAGRAGARRGRAERRSERQCGVAQVRARRAERSSQTPPRGRFRSSRRGAPSSPRSSRPARCALLSIADPAVDHFAPAGRRAADAHSAAGRRRGHAGNLRRDRSAAQLRQHHRAAAAARRRRGVQDLLHHGVARRADAGCCNRC